MKGEPIEAVNVGLQSLVSSLRQDPFALESVHLSIITFDRVVNTVLPMTELELIQLPDIVTPDSGPTHLGMALEELVKRSDSEVIKGSADQKGDWMPLLFIMTDGNPSDSMKYREMIPEVKKRNFANIIACAAGPKAKESWLLELTDSVVKLETADPNTFQQFFQWVSASVSIGNRSMGATEDVSLPPPPDEVRIVI